jgi:hypothetical protein
MNGRTGVVTGWDAERSRYAMSVRLEDRWRHAALKPGNVKPR